MSCDSHKSPSRGAIRKEIRILLISVGLKRYKDCTVGERLWPKMREKAS